VSASLQRVLVGAAVVLWGAAFAGHVLLVARDRIGFAPLYVEPAATPEALPRVTGLWPGTETGESGLRPGDRLASIGGRSAAGLDRAEVLAGLFERADDDYRVPLEVERDGVRRSAALQLQRAALPWRTVFVSFAFAAVGYLAFRRRAAPVTFCFALASLFYALHWSSFIGAGVSHTRFAMAATALAPAIAGPMTVRALLLFPEEVALRSRAARLWPWLLAVNGVFLPSWVFGFPLAPELGRPLALAGNLVLIAVILALLAVQYARASRFGRRQLRWTLLGFYLGLTGPALLAAAALAVPPLWWAYHVSLCAVIAVPIGFFLGLGRDQFLDVDRLISATTTYSLLLGIALAVVLAAAPAASRTLANAADLDPQVTQTLLAAALAALGVPAGRWLRPRVERLLFRERRALETAVGELRSELGGCEKPEQLYERLGSRLHELVRPDGIAIYGRAGDAFAPLFTRGRAIAPAFDARGALPGLLVGAGAPILASRLRRRSARAPLTPAEAGALEAMGVELIVPFLSDEGLEAFLCLGEKASGDVYTDMDRALLQGLAEHATAELRRFGEAETRRQEREMMDKLRRYVPGAIAEELAEGGALEEGEREVSVLFVDVRGYTSFAEGRRAPEIFATVNRYTRAVSDVVLRHGGVVVEFNGDGMMAVFGAPRPLPHKEESAVRAALEVAGAVAGIEVEGSRLSVGVGVATGPAFVGSVRAVDRHIWSALGNTTNLAARLEKLTRDLGVTVAVDADTYRGASALAGGFTRHEGVAIRGRSEPVDVYTAEPPGDGR
jgi:class 3 adenylate cyclase